MATGAGGGVRPALKRVLRSNPGARLILQRPDEDVVTLEDFKVVPGLEAPARIDPDSYIGPTEESNWVIPSRLLVGAYPGAPEDELNSEILTSILELGVTTFVCLQSEYQHHGVTEEQWRSGEKLRPYIFDALQLLETCPADYFPEGRKPNSLDFVHLPIVDCATVSDSKVLSLAQDLCRRLKEGENLYVHCWGGHGRTGTVVSLMLGIMYGLPPMAAMAWVQMFHDMRIAPCGVPSPQTAEQRKQVTRILVRVAKKRDAATATAAAQRVATEAAAARATAEADRMRRRSIAARRGGGGGDPFSQYKAGGVRDPTPDGVGVPALALPTPMTGGGRVEPAPHSASERLPHTARMADRGDVTHAAPKAESARGAAPSAFPAVVPPGHTPAWGAGGGLARARSPEHARPTSSSGGRVTPSSPPPPAGAPRPASSQGGPAPTPPLPTAGATVGFVVPQPPAGVSGRDESIEVKHSSKIRRTGRSFEPVGKSRDVSGTTPRTGRVGDVSISSTHSDLPAAAPGHTSNAGGGSVQTGGGSMPPPAGRVLLGGGGGTRTLPRKDTGGSTASGSKWSWKQPEVESWVDRLAKRKGKAAAASAASRGREAEPDAGALRLTRKSRRRKAASSTTGGEGGGYSSVKSKVPSRRVGRRKGRSTSRRRRKGAGGSGGGTPRSKTGSTHVAPVPPFGESGVGSAASALGGGGLGGHPAPILHLGGPGGGGPLLGALPALAPGKGGVVGGSGRVDAHPLGGKPVHGPPTTARGGESSRRAFAPAPAQGSTRAMASALTSPGGGGAGSTASLASPGMGLGGAPTHHSASTSIMHSHRRVVSGGRRGGPVASRGGGGGRSLKPPPVVMG